MAKIAEIFKSTQGEGRNAGCAAVFVRFSGCNLKCPFCDTDHSGEKYDDCDVAVEVMELVKKSGIKLIIFTGGEPSLQLESMRTIINEIKARGFNGRFAVETNGTCDPTRFHEIGVNFVTISPKCLWVDDPITTDRIDTWVNAQEIKCLYDTTMDVEVLHSFLDDIARRANTCAIKPLLYLQPITDHADASMTAKNIQAVLSYITEVNSEWMISMQLQNIWNVR